MAIYLLALLIGIVAGLRAMTAPAAVSWAAGKDRPAALIEDAVAMVAAILIVRAV
nr:hypothetical protein [Phyllobacterium phragmitis]